MRFVVGGSGKLFHIQVGLYLCYQLVYQKKISSLALLNAIQNIVCKSIVIKILYKLVFCEFE